VTVCVLGGLPLRLPCWVCLCPRVFVAVSPVALPARWCLVFDYGSWYTTIFPDHHPNILPGFQSSLSSLLSLCFVLLRLQAQGRFAPCTPESGGSSPRHPYPWGSAPNPGKGGPRPSLASLLAHSPFKPINLRLIPHFLYRLCNGVGASANPILEATASFGCAIPIVFAVPSAHRPRRYGTSLRCLVRSGPMFPPV